MNDAQRARKVELAALHTWPSPGPEWPPREPCCVPMVKRGLGTICFNASQIPPDGNSPSSPWPGLRTGSSHSAVSPDCVISLGWSCSACDSGCVSAGYACGDTSTRNPHPNHSGLATLSCSCIRPKAVMCTEVVRTQWDTRVYGSPHALIHVGPLFTLYGCWRNRLCRQPIHTQLPWTTAHELMGQNKMLCPGEGSRIPASSMPFVTPELQLQTLSWAVNTAFYSLWQYSSPRHSRKVFVVTMFQQAYKRF